MESSREQMPVYLNKTVVSLGVALMVGAIVGGWIYTLAISSSKIEQLQEQDADFRTRLSNVEGVQANLTNKQAILDVKIDTILDKIQELKTTIDKNFGR